jgi:hypothetical protein
VTRRELFGVVLGAAVGPKLPASLPLWSHGGMVRQPPGGMAVIVGEGDEDEYIVPIIVTRVGPKHTYNWIRDDDGQIRLVCV